MPILYVVLILILIGLALWAANTYIPMDPKIKGIMNVVVVVFVLLWLASMLVPGWFQSSPTVHPIVPAKHAEAVPWRLAA